MSPSTLDDFGSWMEGHVATSNQHSFLYGRSVKGTTTTTIQQQQQQQQNSMLFDQQHVSVQCDQHRWSGKDLCTWYFHTHNDTEGIINCQGTVAFRILDVNMISFL